MTDLASFTLHKAHLLIDCLQKQGVCHFCIAPGSRSTPLALAVKTLSPQLYSIHFDERGLGFYAQGLAKASKKPVVIIVTSATAVANLLPAVVEAFHSRLPLILLSADRPPELRECGANQTINQVNLFQSFTKTCIDLPLSDPLCSDAHLISTASFAIYRSLCDPCGPVQLNCMIREPSFSNKPIDLPSFSCHYEETHYLPSVHTLYKWKELLCSYTQGIILLGSDAIQTIDQSLLLLAEHLGFPIFSDILSGGRAIGDHPFHIEHPDLILKTFPDKQIQVVLQIGNRITSKTISTWLKKQKSIAYFLVADHSQRQDPDHLVTHRMQSPTSFFCENLYPLINKKDPSWALSWKKHANIIKQTLSSFFSENQALSEPYITYSLPKAFHFFFSNSMPIRDADLFLFPQEGLQQVYANRGASGIDGNIATAIGIGAFLCQEKPLVAVLGDLAALHDINSLALWQKSKTPLIFVIINNQGGGIFSFLPIAEKKDVFEEFFATKHSYHFDLLAQTFNLPYFSIDSLAKWQSTWQQIQKHPQTCIVECKTSRKDNVYHHEQIYKEVTKALCSPINLLDPPKNLSSVFCTAS